MDKTGTTADAGVWVPVAAFEEDAAAADTLDLAVVATRDVACEDLLELLAVELPAREELDCARDDAGELDGRPDVRADVEEAAFDDVVLLETTGVTVVVVVLVVKDVVVRVV